MSDDAEAQMTRVIRKLSKSWTCCGCGRLFFPTPTSGFPAGLKTRGVPLTNGDIRREIVGDLCDGCMK